MKSIRLVACTFIQWQSLAMLAAKCPLLEEIECSYHKMPADFFKCVGRVRPHLKRLRVHMHYFDQDELENELIKHVLEEGGEVFEEPFEQREARRNADAFAIAENMHELRLLQIAGHNLTEIGVRAILDGCPHLECLDLSSCHDIYVDGQLQARFAMIRHVRLPGLMMVTAQISVPSVRGSLWLIFSEVSLALCLRRWRWGMVPMATTKSLRPLTPVST